jgi:hypothetical protein
MNDGEILYMGMVLAAFGAFALVLALVAAIAPGKRDRFQGA